MIMNKLDVRNLAPVDWLRFSNTYRAKKGLEYRKADTKYDAWLVVKGESRPLFDICKFFTTYPNIKNRIITLREMMNVRIKDKYNSC